MRDEIEAEGEQSCLASEVYSNPYPLYSDEFNRYERGWTQAQKKVDVGLLTKRPGKQKTVFPLLYPRDKEPAYKPPNSPAAAENYRNRKGK